MTGRRAAALILACLFATVVGPPLFAWTVNQRRVTIAQNDASAIVALLRTNESALHRFGDTVDVLCGPGLVPRAASGAERWIAGPRAPLSALLGERNVPMDPWGNCYAINLVGIRSDASASVWVVSAGPNGIIETAFAANAPVTSLANDIALPVR